MDDEIYHQVLSRKCNRHTTVVELLRYLHMSGGIARFTSVESTVNLMRRGVINPDIHIEYIPNSFSVLTGSGRVLIARATAEAVDYNLMRRYSGRPGVYTITPEGKKCVIAWFDINSET